MSLAIDLILAAVVAICGWRGFRTGIINGVCWILALVVSIYAANIVATAYYSEFSEMLHPFALGLVEKTMSGDEENGDEDDETVIDQNISIDERDDLDVYTVAHEVLTRLGIASSAADSIAAETARMHSQISGQMAVDLTTLLCDRVTFVGLLTIAFILVSIIFTVIGNVLDLSFGIPGHENLNHITGAALGVIRGLLMLVVIGCLCRYIGIVLKPEVIDKSFILHRIVETNKLAELLKI